jgi:hypothetical protein
VRLHLSCRTRRGRQNGRWKVRGIISYAGWIDKYHIPDPWNKIQEEVWEMKDNID